MSIYRADCGSCCGLCCVVPDQLAVQGFAADKPADSPCVHLDGCNRCSIYANRRSHGFPACERFDCFGAGQWVTRELFGGASWTDSPDTARRMFAAYRYWVPRFEVAALIDAALPYVRDDSRGALAARMAELTAGTAATHSEVDDAPGLRRKTLAAIRAALRSDDESRQGG